MPQRRPGLRWALWVWPGQGGFDPPRLAVAAAATGSVVQSGEQRPPPPAAPGNLQTPGERRPLPQTCPPVRGRARSHQPGGLRAGRGARGRSAPSSRRRSRADAGSAVGRSGHTGHPVSEAHLGSRREGACLPGPWEDVGMCGGQLGGGRCRLREPLEPAQPVRVSGVFTAPKETGLAVADWGISRCKGQCAQDRRVTTALGGTVLHPG